MLNMAMHAIAGSGTCTEQKNEVKAPDLKTSFAPFCRLEARPALTRIPYCPDGMLPLTFTGDVDSLALNWFKRNVPVVTEKN